MTSTARDRGHRRRPGVQRRRRLQGGGAGSGIGRPARVNPGVALRAATKPVVCAVNGACVTGALEIALSCTFIVASERARFADTHACLDVVAAWGLTALLPRAVGVRKAAELSITGNFVDADEALRTRAGQPRGPARRAAAVHRRAGRRHRADGRGRPGARPLPPR